MSTSEKKFTEKTEPMDPETRKKLVEYFRNDIEKLAVITGKDLSDWLK